MKTVSHQLKIELSTAEGAMLRALGLMERRGYLLQTCQLHSELEGKKVLEIRVESNRPAALLKKQLERLHDVLSVTVKNPTREVAQGLGAGARPS
jgi:acetolactate synthase regulatory subunit